MQKNVKSLKNRSFLTYFSLFYGKQEFSTKSTISLSLSIHDFVLRYIKSEKYFEKVSKKQLIGPQKEHFGAQFY